MSDPTLQELSADSLGQVAATADTAIATLEDALANYIGAANAAADEWRSEHGLGGPIQKIGRDAPDNLSRAGEYAQFAVKRAISRAAERARVGNWQGGE